MKVLKFDIDCYGITNLDLSADCSFYVELPENWDNMSEEEQEEFANSTIKETAQWSWWVDEE